MVEMFVRRRPLWPALIVAICVLASGGLRAQTATEAQPAKGADDPSAVKSFGWFMAGGLGGLVAHEGGHVLFNVAFDSDPVVRRVEFHGIPFFAITHRRTVSPRREFAIASAGFWVQHAGSEWILTRHPGLRQQRAPFAKGVLAFNVLASGAYAGAAFARTGPIERDTRGMAQSSGTDERWIGAMVLAPAVLDVWRYFDPDAAWAKWTSRAVKIGTALLILK